MTTLDAVTPLSVAPIVQPVPISAALPISPLLPCPRMRTILHRIATSIVVAIVIPATLFWITLVLFGLRTAVVAALVWSGLAMGWRRATKRASSALLLVAAVTLTVRSVITLATGDAFIYFIQPVISDAAVSLTFLLSLATATPLVARFASEYFPMEVDVAARPAIRRLLWRLTLLWGVVVMVKGVLSFWLLESMSTADFVMVKSVSIFALTVCTTVLTVAYAARVARREGLLGVTPA